MTRKEKISKAKELTLKNRGHNVFLHNNYLEGTPEQIAKRIHCEFIDSQIGKKHIWYINRQGIAEVI